MNSRDDELKKEAERLRALLFDFETLHIDVSTTVDPWHNVSSKPSDILESLKSAIDEWKQRRDEMKTIYLDTDFAQTFDGKVVAKSVALCDEEGNELFVTKSESAAAIIARFILDVTKGESFRFAGVNPEPDVEALNDILGVEPEGLFNVVNLADIVPKENRRPAEDLGTHPAARVRMMRSWMQ